MDKHQVTGRVKEAEGKIKEKSGKVFGNKTMEEKGRLEKHLGNAEAKYGDVKSGIKKDIERERERKRDDE